MDPCHHLLKTLMRKICFLDLTNIPIISMMPFLLIHNIALRQCRARIGMCKWVKHSNIKNAHSRFQPQKSQATTSSWAPSSRLAVAYCRGLQSRGWRAGSTPACEQPSLRRLAVRSCGKWLESYHRTTESMFNIKWFATHTHTHVRTHTRTHTQTHTHTQR